MIDKVIWVTGASSGIGKALAIKFAKEDWKVAISARRENLLNEIAKTHNNIFPYPLDVTDSEKCKSVFSNIKEKFKNVDISVFCTGIHDPKSERSLNLDKVRQIMEVNFFGTVNSINAVYNYYKDRKSGQISIVASVAGYRGLPAGGAYCSSKSALTSFAVSLYFDLKCLLIPLFDVTQLQYHILLLIHHLQIIVELLANWNTPLILLLLQDLLKH